MARHLKPPRPLKTCSSLFRVGHNDKMIKSTKSSSGFSFFIFLSFYSLISSVPTEPEEKVQLSLKPLLRNRRDVCADGTYVHENRSCCLCAAGQRLKQHCTSKPDDGICELCEAETYSSHPNFQTSCEPCTSCDQSNANLEVEEKCTPGRNTKCRCKPNHFCSTEMCKICQPCDTCGFAGIKEPCTPKRNTVCNNETNNVGVIVGVIVGVVLVLVAGIVFGLKYWKKKQESSQRGIEISEREPLDLSVPEVDMRPLIPDIANRLGWHLMKEIAQRSGMLPSAIDSVQVNHPHNSEEWTVELLGKWVESKGKCASKDLIEMLQKSGKMDTAQKISKIIKSANAVTPSSSL